MPCVLAPDSYVNPVQCSGSVIVSSPPLNWRVGQSIPAAVTLTDGQIVTCSSPIEKLFKFSFSTMSSHGNYGMVVVRDHGYGK